MCGKCILTIPRLRAAKLAPRTVSTRRRWCHQTDGLRRMRQHKLESRIRRRVRAWTHRANMSSITSDHPRTHNGTQPAALIRHPLRTRRTRETRQHQHGGACRRALRSRLGGICEGWCLLRGSLTAPTRTHYIYGDGLVAIAVGRFPQGTAYPARKLVPSIHRPQ